MKRTMDKTQEGVRDELQARFDSREFYCQECHGQARLLVAFLIGDTSLGQEPNRHLAYMATGFCCRHLGDRADFAFGEACKKLDLAGAL